MLAEISKLEKAPDWKSMLHYAEVSELEKALKKNARPGKES